LVILNCITFNGKLFSFGTSKRLSIAPVFCIKIKWIMRLLYSFDVLNITTLLICLDHPNQYNKEQTIISKITVWSFWTVHQYNNTTVLLPYSIFVFSYKFFHGNCINSFKKKILVYHICPYLSNRRPWMPKIARKATM
jgi:hypothetical protein